MLSQTNQNRVLSPTDTLYASFLKKIQDWIRREILDEDPYDEAALLEGALLAELMKQEQMHHHQSPSSYRLDQECQEISSMLRQNFHNPGCL